MPIAIDRHMWIAAAKSGSRQCSVWPLGLGLESPAKFSLDELTRRTDPSESWLNYLFGVIKGYEEAGIEVPGFEAVITSDLPSGAGLSSSAALETATALALEALTGVAQDRVDRALLCQRAEHEWAGVPCGIMDQLAVGASRKGAVLHLDCRDLKMEFYPLPAGLAILTADTGVKHALGDGEYRKRREECEAVCSLLGVKSLRDAEMEELEAAREQLGDVLYRRGRHAVSEMARVEAFADALKRNEEVPLGDLMRGSHASLRDDFEVSCEELDFLVDAAYQFGSVNGLIGSRMTGGGFGGSTVSLVRADAADALQQYLVNTYQEKFGRDLNCFITSAVDGAQIVPL